MVGRAVAWVVQVRGNSKLKQCFAVVVIGRGDNGAEWATDHSKGYRRTETGRCSLLNWLPIFRSRHGDTWKGRLLAAGYASIVARSDRTQGVLPPEIIKAVRAERGVAPAAKPFAQSLPRLRQTAGTILGQLLQIPPRELDHSAAFTEFGMDSIGAVALAKELNRQLGTELKPTILFDYGSIEKLATFLATQVNQLACRCRALRLQ